MLLNLNPTRFTWHIDIVVVFYCYFYHYYWYCLRHATFRRLEVTVIHLGDQLRQFRTEIRSSSLSPLPGIDRDSLRLFTLEDSISIL